MRNITKSLIGKVAILVIDIQKGCFIDPDSSEAEEEPIASMPGYRDRMSKSKKLIASARERDLPIIFIQEVHRNDLSDMGRELDGDEGVHCLDSDPYTALAKEELGFQEGDYEIIKRRYSAFYGTDLEILLRGLKVETLVLCGGLTNVCVHYTFVDAHQGDYYCRVVTDCVAGSSFDAHDEALRAIEYLQHDALHSLNEMQTAIKNM